jgi:hypothetical protein
MVKTILAMRKNNHSMNENSKNSINEVSSNILGENLNYQNK